MKIDMIYPPCLTLGESTTICIQFSISRSLSLRERQRIKAAKDEASKRHTSVHQEWPESIVVLMANAGRSEVLVNELQATRGTDTFQLTIPPIYTTGIVHLVLISRSEPQDEGAVGTHWVGGGPCVAELAGYFTRLVMQHVTPTEPCSQRENDNKDQKERNSLDSIPGSSFAGSNIGHSQTQAEQHEQTQPGPSGQVLQSSGHEEEALGFMPVASDALARYLADSEGYATGTGILLRHFHFLQSHVKAVSEAFSYGAPWTPPCSQSQGGSQDGISSLESLEAVARDLPQEGTPGKSGPNALLSAAAGLQADHNIASCSQGEPSQAAPVSSMFHGGGAASTSTQLPSPSSHAAHGQETAGASIPKSSQSLQSSPQDETPVVAGAAEGPDTTSVVHTQQADSSVMEIFQPTVRFLSSNHLLNCLTMLLSGENWSTVIFKLLNRLTMILSECAKSGAVGMHLHGQRILGNNITPKLVRKTGPHQTGPQQTGPHAKPLGLTRLDLTRSLWASPDWASRKVSGSHQTGPHQTGPHQTEPHTKPHQTEPRQTRPHQTGPQQTEPNAKPHQTLGLTSLGLTRLGLTRLGLTKLNVTRSLTRLGLTRLGLTQSVWASPDWASRKASGPHQTEPHAKPHQTEPHAEPHQTGPGDPTSELHGELSSGSQGELQHGLFGGLGWGEHQEVVGGSSSEMSE
eukprot:gene24668-10296_t